MTALALIAILALLLTGALVMLYMLTRENVRLHSEIAKLLSTTYKVPSWWTQMVTVGYERLKGLRARGQRRDGTYEAGKSRTFDVPVATLFEAWADAKIRRRWLDEPGVMVRTATAPKWTARIQPIR